MKRKCTVSHEVPLGNGRFKKYVAGQEYEIEEESPYFEAAPKKKSGKKVEASGGDD